MNPSQNDKFNEEKINFSAKYMHIDALYNSLIRGNTNLMIQKHPMRYKAISI